MAGPHLASTRPQSPPRTAVLKLLLQEGLEMEILSYKIYLEEPSACVLISNAINRVIN